MDMILVKCKFPSLFSVTYVVGTHWNCLYEAIPMCTYNICLSINDFFIIRFFLNKFSTMRNEKPGPVAQSVTCLATDACLTADPGVASSIPARSHTFVEIDHEIISTVILLPSSDSFKKGCCQLQAKVCAQITG